MNVQTIKSDIDFLCGSTSATYLDADKMRNVNICYHDVARSIWEADGTWTYDDANNTDSPIAYRTITASSASYLIPTTAIRVEGVEVKDGAGHWQKLKPLDYHTLSVSPEEFLKTPGMPIYYQLEGTQVRLFPPPGTGYATFVSGMAVRLSREVTELAVTATTTTPGFPASFHRILSLSAALDFVQDNQQRQFLLLQKARLEKGLANFYSKRGAEYKSQIKPASKRRWRLYV
ncbi:hypothetical protein GW915_00605 [bacterium]|nr:hypothetical protein [bacterium]